MRIGSVLFLLGIYLLVQRSELPALAWALCLPAAVMLAVRGREWRWPAWIVAGFLWALLRGHLALAPAFDTRLEGQTLRVVGTIASLPADRGRMARFDFAIRELWADDGTLRAAPERVRLSWYASRPRLVPGEEWRLRIRLKRPHGFRNPGGFDYEGWLFQNRIRATGYVVESVGNAPTGRSEFTIHRYRHQLRLHLDALLGDSNMTGMLKALAIGDNSGIDADDWRVLTATGTGHLLAISGLHITLIAGMCFFLGRWSWSLSATATSAVPAQRAGLVIALAGATLYSALAGFSIPTQRALVMALVWLAAAFSARNPAFSEVLALAMFGVLLIDPFAVLAPGTWLSFLAVAALAWGMGCRVGPLPWYWQWGRAQMVIFIGLLPVLATWFAQVPLLSIPANLIAVPWVSLLTTPLILFGCVLAPISYTLAQPFMQLGLWTMTLLWPMLSALAGLRLNLLEVPPPGWPALFAALAGATILLLPRGVPGRWLGVLWMLPLLFPAAPVPAHGQFHFTLLDVGQGLSAVVRTERHALLYDAGPAFSDDFSAGSAVIVPYLRQAGIAALDLVIVSHGDEDHSGGLPDVLAAIPAWQIMASAPERIRGARAGACRAGQKWRWDGVDFLMLHPPEDFSAAGNDRSCVLRVSGANLSVLLPGDVELPGELRLTELRREELRSTVVVAPHHGSRTSSSMNFIEAVRPRWVLFATGFRNRYGFPKHDIIARYRQLGARPLETARAGAIEFQTDADGYSYRTQRGAERRFWHSRP